MSDMSDGELYKQILFSLSYEMQTVLSFPHNNLYTATFMHKSMVMLCCCTIHNITTQPRFIYYVHIIFVHK